MPQQYKSVSPAFLSAIRKETSALALRTANTMQAAWKDLLPADAVRPASTAVCITSCLISASRAQDTHPRALDRTQARAYRAAIATLASVPHANANEFVVASDAVALCEGLYPTREQLLFMQHALDELGPEDRTFLENLFQDCVPTTPAVVLRKSEHVWATLLAFITNRRTCGDPRTSIASLASASILNRTGNARTYAVKIGCTPDETNWLARFLNGLYQTDARVKIPIVYDVFSRPMSLTLPTFVDSYGNTYAFHVAPPAFETTYGRAIVQLVVTHTAYEARHRRPKALGWNRGFYHHNNDLRDATYAGIAATRATLPFVSPLSTAADYLSGWSCVEPPATGKLNPTLTTVMLPLYTSVFEGIVLWPNTYVWAYPAMVVVPISSRQVSSPTASTRSCEMRYIYECYCFAYSR